MTDGTPFDNELLDEYSEDKNEDGTSSRESGSSSGMAQNSNNPSQGSASEPASAPVRKEKTHYHAPVSISSFGKEPASSSSSSSTPAVSAQETAEPQKEDKSKPAVQEKVQEDPALKEEPAKDPEPDPAPDSSREGTASQQPEEAPAAPKTEDLSSPSKAEEETDPDPSAALLLEIQKTQALLAVLKESLEEDKKVLDAFQPLFQQDQSSLQDLQNSFQKAHTETITLLTLLANRTTGNGPALLPGGEFQELSTRVNSLCETLSGFSQKMAVLDSLAQYLEKQESQTEEEKEAAREREADALLVHFKEKLPGFSNELLKNFYDKNQEHIKASLDDMSATVFNSNRDAMVKLTKSYDSVLQQSMENTEKNLKRLTTRISSATRPFFIMMYIAMGLTVATFITLMFKIH